MDLLLKQQSGSSQAASCAGISFFSISKMDFYFKSLLLYQQDEGKLFLRVHKFSFLTCMYKNDLLSGSSSKCSCNYKFILRFWRLMPPFYFRLQMTRMMLITLKWIFPTLLPPTAPPVVIYVTLSTVHLRFMPITPTLVHLLCTLLLKYIRSNAVDGTSVVSRWT